MNYLSVMGREVSVLQRGSTGDRCPVFVRFSHAWHVIFTRKEHGGWTKDESSQRSTAGFVYGRGSINDQSICVGALMSWVALGLGFALKLGFWQDVTLGSRRAWLDLDRKTVSWDAADVLIQLD